MHYKLSLTVLLIFFLISVLYSQSSNELIVELKELNQSLDYIHQNSKILTKSNIITSQIVNIKNRILMIKKKLSTISNDLNNPIYFDNDIVLDNNIDLNDLYIYELSSTFYELHARIKNKQKKYLNWVKLRFNFYSNGSFIGTDYTYIDFESYGYAGISPYKYSFIDTFIDITDFDSIAYQIEYDVENGQDDILWDQLLNLQSIVIKPSGVLYKWQGVVNNDFAYSIKFPNIFACILKDDKMVCTDYTYLDVQNDSLPANSSGVFDSYIDLPTDYDTIKYYITYSLYSLNGSGNIPPNKPIFAQQYYNGVSREKILFDIFVIDPNGDHLDLLVDFGDGSAMNWQEGFYSGYNATIQHSFSSDGQFQVKSKSKNSENLETDWSECIVTDISQSTTPKLKEIALDTAYYKNNYYVQLDASDGILPYSWLVTNGSLPDGLSLNLSSGIISGLPTKSGNFEFTITVSDAGSPTFSDKDSSSILVINNSPVIVSDDTINTFTNTQITYVASATDPDGNSLLYDFINYPSWLTKTNTTLSGTTPDMPLDTSFSVIAIDGELNDTLKVILIIIEQTSIQSQEITPNIYRLYPNYPNPFNSQTNIKIGLPKESNLKIIIYDINGKTVEKIYEGKLNQGYHNFTWNAINQPTGIYFIKMQSATFSTISKCLLLK